MRRKISTLMLVLPAILISAISFTACNSDDKPTTSNGESAPAPSPSPAPKPGFEEDLNWVSKGQYTYIWVFSRKDGKPLDKEDGAYLRTNAPQVVDWVTTEQGKKVIAGTNFDLAEGNLELLKKRFIAEDYTGR